MKGLRKCALLCAMAACAAMAKAGDTYKVAFALEDFEIVTEEGITAIRPADDAMCFLDEPGLPALPYKTVNILRDQQSRTLYDIAFTKVLVASGVAMEANPEHYPTSLAAQLADSLPTVSSVSVDTPAIFTGDHILKGYSFCSFSVTPFLYDAEAKELYFVPEVTLTLTGQEAGTAARARALGSNATATPKVDTSMEDFVKGFVINPGEMEDKYGGAGAAAGARRSVKYNRAASAYAADDEGRDVEYLVVTSEALAEAFRPLVEWKRRKGLWAEIVTVEDIAQTYEGDSLQQQIKHCLYDYYTNKNLKWVLLGGGVDVVPKQTAYLRASYYTLNNIPVDLYYACFDEPFDWDLNGNGILGEREDSVDIYPEVYLARLTANTAEEAKIMVDKILKYETAPNEDGYLDRFLLSGAQLYNTWDGKSDAQITNETYKTRLTPYWDGEFTELYDTGSSLGGDTVLNYENLTAQINKGYHLLNMVTHGEEDGWQMTNGYVKKYISDNALTQTNADATIIVTSACRTNRFGHDFGIWASIGVNTVFSEAFMKNPNGACLAYLGSSSYGFTSTSKGVLGTSEAYNVRFFEHLFTTESGSIGEALAKAKLYYASQATGYTIVGWVYRALNLLGDPEMQVWTQKVRHFEEPSVTTSGRSVTVTTGGVDSCTITLMSRDDGGLTYYNTVKGVSSYTFTGVNAPFSVTITKRNYIPYQYEHEDDDFGQGEEYDTLSVDTGRLYRIRNAATQQCLSGGRLAVAYGTDTVAGSVVTDGNGGFGDIWRFEEAGDKIYRLLNLNAGTYLAAAAGSAVTTASQDGADTYAVLATGADSLLIKLAGTAGGDAFLQARGGTEGGDTVGLAATTGAGAAWTLEEVDGVAVAIGEAGWTSLCLPFGVALAEGLTAYTGGTESGDAIELEEVEGGGIAANTPVLLSGAQGSYVLSVDNGGTAPAAGGNTLRGTTVCLTSVPQGTFYGLMDGSNGVGFYYGGEEATLIPANKAYLERDAGDTTSYVRFTFGETATGIPAVAQDGEQETYYDLQGRRVSNPSRGIYVTDDGRKVFIK